MPRVGKLKDFINSAAEKFEIPKVAGVTEDSYVLTNRYGKTK